MYKYLDLDEFEPIIREDKKKAIFCASSAEFFLSNIDAQQSLEKWRPGAVTALSSVIEEIWQQCFHPPYDKPTLCELGRIVENYTPDCDYDLSWDGLPRAQYAALIIYTTVKFFISLNNKRFFEVPTMCVDCIASHILDIYDPSGTKGFDQVDISNHDDYVKEINRQILLLRALTEKELTLNHIKFIRKQCKIV